MINYSLISESILYYEKSGFARIETPWTVTKSVSDITRPVNAGEFSIKEKNKVLVASGEQSFLYLYLKEFLPKGQFQTVTPCFRDENFDELHTKYFIKNELIKTDSITISDLKEIVSLAKGFFIKYLGEKNVAVVDTSVHDSFPSYDICTIDGIELGSYGMRECSFIQWIYGTGVAEPRLSNIMRKYGISLKTN